MLDARDGIRRAIRDSGMKQIVVAERAGLSEQQLCDIVKKRRKMDANKLFNLCTVLNIPPDIVFKDVQGKA